MPNWQDAADISVLMDFGPRLAWNKPLLGLREFGEAERWPYPSHEASVAYIPELSIWQFFIIFL